MSDQPSAPADQPAPQPVPQHNYLVRCLNGWEIKIASPMDLLAFRHMAKANGFIPSDKMTIEFCQVVSIEYLGPFVPGQNVSAFAARLTPQLVT